MLCEFVVNPKTGSIRKRTLECKTCKRTTCRSYNSV